ncbi:hypothetical protein OFN34_34730, partial [Escherichia coli]|nr:hypothetical protein [Escherichia coli]
MKRLLLKKIKQYPYHMQGFWERAPSEKIYKNNLEGIEMTLFKRSLVCIAVVGLMAGCNDDETKY